MAGFEEYIQKTKERPASTLLKEALEFIEKSEGATALDLGAGGLKDARELLEKGFKVTAIDKESTTRELGDKLENQNLTVLIEDLEGLTIPQNTFDLILSNNVLSFLPRAGLDLLLTKIISGLKTGGILAVSFFGPKNELRAQTTMSKEEAEIVLSGLEILKLYSIENDAPLVNQPGIIRHMHVVRVIARKTGMK